MLADTLDHILDLGVQFVLMGTGDQHYHELFTRLTHGYPDQAAIFLTFDPALAQRIYGGTDMFVVPSRVEPCGQSQMIAMRYGAVPVVRETGGLADTVTDWNPTHRLGQRLRLQGVRSVGALRRAGEGNRDLPVPSGLAKAADCGHDSGLHVGAHCELLCGRVPEIVALKTTLRLMAERRGHEPDLVGLDGLPDRASRVTVTAAMMPSSAVTTTMPSMPRQSANGPPSDAPMNCPTPRKTE